MFLQRICDAGLESQSISAIWNLRDYIAQNLYFDMIKILKSLSYLLLVSKTSSDGTDS